MNARLVTLLLLTACSSGPSPSRPTATTTPVAPVPPVVPVVPVVPSASANVPTMTPLLCAYGGVGIVPDPLPPGFETMFATLVVQVDNPGPPIAGVTLTNGSLRNAAGTTLSSLIRIDHFVVLPEIEPTGPTMGSFAVYLNPDGSAFDGTLPTGRTILRARFSITSTTGAFPDHCHLELSGASVSLVSDGALDGVWASS